MPILNPERLGLDLGLTCVVSTQLWHHTYRGGGLCDLPIRTAPSVVLLEKAHPKLVA